MKKFCRLVGGAFWRWVVGPAPKPSSPPVAPSVPSEPRWDETRLGAAHGRSFVFAGPLYFREGLELPRYYQQLSEPVTLAISPRCLALAFGVPDLGGDRAGASGGLRLSNESSVELASRQGQRDIFAGS